MAKDFEYQATEATPEHKHETKDVKSMTVILAMIVIMLILGAVHLVLLLVGGWFERAHKQEYDPVAALETTPVVPPEPRLQPNPAKDLADLMDKENKLVTTYGWTDRKTGLARVPIDRALDLVAQRGLPPKTIDMSTSWTWTRNP